MPQARVSFLATRLVSIILSGEPMDSARQLRHRCHGGEGRAGGLSSSLPASGLLCDSMKQGMFTLKYSSGMRLATPSELQVARYNYVNYPKISHQAYCSLPSGSNQPIILHYPLLILPSIRSVWLFLKSPHRLAFPTG